MPYTSTSLNQRFGLFAHEIRTPIANIKNSADLLKHTSENQDYYIDLITREANRLQRIAEHMILLVNPKEIECIPIDIAPLTENIVTTFTLMAKQRNVAIHFQHDLHEKYVIAGVEAFYENIISNLIKNAIEACEREGRVEVILQQTMQHVILTVVDNGVGIENVDPLFDMFYTTKMTGIGIGLSVVKKCTDFLGATIEIDSKLGEGTIFHIKFPMYNS